MDNDLEIHNNIGIAEWTEDHHVMTLILPTWRKKRWVEFDSAWLLLRDACANGVHDQDSGLTMHRKNKENREILPLFDSVQAIQEAIRGTNLSHTDPSHLSAIYHAFSELSKLVVGWKHPYTGSKHEETFHRWNRFFYGLWKGSKFLDYEAEYQLTDRGFVMSINRDFHCQNMLLFITSRHDKHVPPGSKHLTELNILLANRWGERNPINLISSNSSSRLPRYLHLEIFHELNETLCWQFNHVLMKFLKYAAGVDFRTGPGFLHAHYGVVRFLEQSAWATRCSMDFVNHSTSDTAVGEEIDLREAYRAIFISIGEQLNHFISLADSDATVLPEMSYFFYTSAIYVQDLKTSPWFESSEAKYLVGDLVNIVLPTMRLYKKKFPGVSTFLEGQFKGEERMYPLSVRFSKEWWAFLDDNLPTGPEAQATLQEESQPQSMAAEISKTHSGPAKPFGGFELPMMPLLADQPWVVKQSGFSRLPQPMW
ncbi:hypothetical protein GALMADRAFT_216974 [Galerina marginata CBS 339.88]|uniref:Uncharacterized protein n=1 Tax=Galerina marginata (strain CBS 339.88) TaxID=685588 RepID=A0A067S724_GALM3|nr:hypothetical protein GALMADRAFT_216974 [Galerina marginata CBS 339.88]